MNDKDFLEHFGIAGMKLAEGLVEVKNRKTGERQDVAVTKIVSHLKSII